MRVERVRDGYLISTGQRGQVGVSYRCLWRCWCSRAVVGTAPSCTVCPGSSSAVLVCCAPRSSALGPRSPVLSVPCRYSNVIKQNWVQKNVLKLDFERKRDRACESKAGGLRWSGVRAPWRCEVRGCQGLRTAETRETPSRRRRLRNG
ncbi:uncharacterized protein LOC122243020 [Penaeus japonicus]|uniref:uncharacterized protein LOC122243020 n=1 Tax=Penaeus japonicus TaxID=27405 RepID=UPI001C70EB05|nr:uncharacterized protein LOC122243020 [Penaeus japonicus]